MKNILLLVFIILIAPIWIKAQNPMSVNGKQQVSKADSLKITDVTTATSNQYLFDVLTNIYNNAGSDNQTASEVNITDSGVYYTGTDVETALQEVGGWFLVNTKTIDFANITTGNATTDTITVTGAAVGDNVVVSGDVSIPSLGILKAEVTAIDTFTVTYINFTGSDSDLASGTFRATVIKY